MTLKLIWPSNEAAPVQPDAAIFVPEEIEVIPDDLANYLAEQGYGHGRPNEAAILWKFMTPMARRRHVGNFKLAKLCRHCDGPRPCETHPEEIISKCPHELAEGDEWCEVCQPRMQLTPQRCENEFCVDAHFQPEDPRVNFVVLAKDGDTEMEYANVEHSHFGDAEGRGAFHVIRVVRINRNGTIRLKFWAENLQEWLECDVPWYYRMTVDPEYLKLAARPIELSPEARASRAAHLLKYKKERAVLQPEPAQPDKCIVGQIGANKVLVDAGDGSVLAAYPPAGFVPQFEAQKLGRKLVGQAQATRYALVTLRRAWADAKAGK